jgi:ADP-ribose pyrophosphatase YjhB (NUDIX family)
MGNARGNSHRSERPVRRVVSVVIASPEAPERVLAVLRPPDDPDLPDVWGLPAGRVRPGERPDAAAVRVGREKLGVELTGFRPRASGTTERADYTLHMDLFDAEVGVGEPSVPQSAPEVTQYAAWQWASPAILAPAMERGSLCCRLFFESEG